MKAHLLSETMNPSLQQFSVTFTDVYHMKLYMTVREWFQECLRILAACHLVFLWVLLPILSSWVPFYFLFCTPFWWIIVLYGVWYIYDFNTPAKGSRKSILYRNAAIWKYFAEYFPLKLVKTTDLPPNKNYIMGCHPHGVFSVGAFTSLCTEATGFSNLFPGLDSTILTLAGQFYFPVRREVGEFLGGCECSRKSLTYLLNHPGKGRLIGIVVGGAEEALDAAPGKNDLHILSRRGFIRFALQHGADLVPSYSFGENEIYEQTHPNPRGSKLRRLQTIIKQRFGFCPPLFLGRSIWSNGIGILPFRKPVTTVVGAPIPVTKIVEPTTAQVEELHKKYCVALLQLFETHKSNYLFDKTTQLNLH